MRWLDRRFAGCRAAHRERGRERPSRHALRAGTAPPTNLLRDPRPASARAGSHPVRSSTEEALARGVSPSGPLARGRTPRPRQARARGVSWKIRHGRRRARHHRRTATSSPEALRAAHDLAMQCGPYLQVPFDRPRFVEALAFRRREFEALAAGDRLEGLRGRQPALLHRGDAAHPQSASCARSSSACSSTPAACGSSSSRAWTGSRSSARWSNEIGELIRVARDQDFPFGFGLVMRNHIIHVAPGRPVRGRRQSGGAAEAGPLAMLSATRTAPVRRIVRMSVLRADRHHDADHPGSAS